MNALRFPVLFVALICSYGCSTASSSGLYGTVTERALKEQETLDEKINGDFLKEYRKGLAAISRLPESYLNRKEKGKLLFFIGEASNDLDYTYKALELLEVLQDENPDDHEVTAFLGAGYTIKARDFPYKFLSYATPIGYYRLYYATKGVNMLNDAVDADELNPLPRIIRGQTFVSLPGLLNREKTGVKDIETVLDWLEGRSHNREYATLIRDKAFANNVYYLAAEVFHGLGKGEKAVELYKKAIQSSPDTIFSQAASARLAITHVEE